MFRQSKNFIRKDICDIIRDFVDGFIQYNQMTQKLGPYIFQWEDYKIADEKTVKLIQDLVDILNLYIEEEIPHQVRLKQYLRKLVEKNSV
jgi:hypothetical protein